MHFKIMKKHTACNLLKLELALWTNSYLTLWELVTIFAAAFILFNFMSIVYVSTSELSSQSSQT